MMGVKYKPYKHNPRKITKKQLEALEDTLRRFGDLSGIIYNTKSKSFVGGNQRSKTIDFDNCEIEIIEKFDKADSQGTTAIGYVIWEGSKYNYREVNWNPKKEKEANIVANKGGGDWDFEILKEHFNGNDLKKWGFKDKEIYWLEDIEGEQDNSYTKKVKSPLYEPSDILPDISELYDDEYYKKLIRDINASKIPEGEKEFLRKAASRHIVFNYEKIADFYSGSDKDVQSLIEGSALVIIDFKKAIELGFVRLTEELRTQYLEDYEK